MSRALLIASVLLVLTIGADYARKPPDITDDVLPGELCEPSLFAVQVSGVCDGYRYGAFFSGEEAPDYIAAHKQCCVYGCTYTSLKPLCRYYE